NADLRSTFFIALLLFYLKVSTDTLQMACADVSARQTKHRYLRVLLCLPTAPALPLKKGLRHVPRAALRGCYTICPHSEARESSWSLLWPRCSARSRKFQLHPPG